MELTKQVIKDFHHILYLDIETVPQQAQYSEVEGDLHALWADKARSLMKMPRGSEISEEEAAAYYSNAGIYAEFGKIICISVGYYIKEEEHWRFALQSFAGHDEKVLLQEFGEFLSSVDDRGQKRWTHLCGHNIKEFDIPYLCRRMLILGLELPPLLDTHGKKPWELTYLIDTLELWRFGDYKSYTSLKLLCGVFGIPSPKDDIDGSMVGQVYWETGEVDRIARYCEKDVLAVAQLLRKYAGWGLMEEKGVKV